MCRISWKKQGAEQWLQQHSQAGELLQQLTVQIDTQVRIQISVKQPVM